MGSTMAKIYYHNIIVVMWLLCALQSSVLKRVIMNMNLLSGKCEYVKKCQHDEMNYAVQHFLLFISSSTNSNVQCMYIMYVLGT